MLEFEERLKENGYTRIAGVDEAGRGPLAGPVVSAAVILKEGFDLPGLNDSKKLTEKRREALYGRIFEESEAVGVGIVEAPRIDAINILQASLESMRIAVEEIAKAPDYLLVDGKFPLKMAIPDEPIVKGDSRSASIAAASIIAKVTRDRIMKEMDAKYPGYGLAGHKGYPTRAHKEAIRNLGPTPIHRMSFRGVRDAD